MTVEEVQELKLRVEDKKLRDMIYLRRRQKQNGGLDTPTDTILKQDQVMYLDILQLLEKLIG